MSYNPGGRFGGGSDDDSGTDRADRGTGRGGTSPDGPAGVDGPDPAPPEDDGDGGFSGGGGGGRTGGTGRDPTRTITERTDISAGVGSPGGIDAPDISGTPAVEAVGRSNLGADPDTGDVDGAEADVVGGFGTRVSYKGLSLNAFFDYSYGKHVYQNTLSSYTSAFGENVWGELRNRWKEPGDVAPYPRSTPFGAFDSAQDPGATSNYWLFRVNYLRLKNITLSYNLPSNLADQVGLRGARIYVTGLNLVDWQSVPGIEPEASGTLEEGDYPTEQQLNVGVELDL